MISFIVPTTGRPTLQRTLESIETRPGDEILVVGNVDEMTNVDAIQDVLVRFIPYPCHGGWGGAERAVGTSYARGKYLSFMDDDDCYARGARFALGMAILSTPDRPMIFRMRYPNGMYLWQDQAIRCGNVGTPMIVVPNVPEKLGVWSDSYVADFEFLTSMKWSPDEVVWRPEIIAELGH